jgi:SAM-dependent methyltransferase
VTGGDLTVVIPTMGRWDILGRTLGGLAQQSSGGFEVVVVSDGAGPMPAHGAPGVSLRVVEQEGAGPGAARNRGVAESSRRLVLFLGDDMVPEPGLVAAHLAAHGRHPEAESAVLGKVQWHADVAGLRLNRWLDRSGTQFDYAGVEREAAGQADYDPGFGRFYSCNVSLKRSLLEAVGGFDESYVFYYEDLDLAWRLSEKGLRLVYEPAALVHHLHAYDWAAMERRFAGIALGERQLAQARPEFVPFFHQRIAAAGAAPLPRRRQLWADTVIGAATSWAERFAPPSRSGLSARLARRTDLAFHRRLARPFLESWEAAGELGELREYLGAGFRPDLMIHHREAVDREARGAGDEATFYRTSQAYLYDLTAFSMSGVKRPYLQQLMAQVPAGSRVLDYGCGIGSDGLALAEAGYEVSFADYDNPSTRYLRWRLQRRGLTRPVYDIEVDEIPAPFDAVMCLDVIEHMDDPAGFLERLEALGRVVMVNFLEPEEGDTHLHHRLDIEALVRHARAKGLLSYRVFHGRSHLVVYSSSGGVSRRAAELAWWRGRVRTR